MAKELDLAVLAWPPLGSALLSGKYKKTDGKAAGRLADKSFRFTYRNNDIVDTVIEIAANTDVKPNAGY
jgi:aryl-alcohol dehydrogenase-like predicted oxidoreductase